jgi:tripartite ATP-independent transporter DctM subunit
MTSLEVGLTSVVAIIVLIYLGVHVAVALGLVSFVGVMVMRGSVDVAEQLLVLAATQGIAEYAFGVIPLFVLMGIVVATADLGRDSYEVAHQLFARVRGGIGVATVAANALFAAITGISIASVAVFTKISVPEMLRFGYAPRLAVGVVAGSSVLGMLIPPSVLLIIYGLITETSVGSLFIAGIAPGVLLAACYCLLIVGIAFVRPEQVGLRKDGSRIIAEETAGLDPKASRMTSREMIAKLGPIVGLIVLVLGGIYGGVFTPTEAGAVGAFATLVIAAARRKLTLPRLWRVVVETGHVTASVLFLVIAATMYSRMLGVTGLPTQLGSFIAESDLGYVSLICVYILVLLLLGAILDSVSILLITVPLFVPVFAPYGVDLVWLGIVSVIAIEIGLLTPPLGLSVYVLKATLGDTPITLADIFMGAMPFAAVMLAVLVLIIAFPALSLMLVY